MPNYSWLLEDLTMYNDDEIFYREYYYAKYSKNPDALQKFLQKHSQEEIIARKLICPELYPINTSYLTEFDRYSKFDSLHDIRIIKHNRYSPSFEHSHDFFELFYVMSGNCLHTINGNTENLKPGTLCFISPEQVHSVGVFNDSIILIIQIKKSTFDDFFFNLLRSNNILTEFFLGNMCAKSNVSHLIFHFFDHELEDLLLSMFLEQEKEDEYTNRLMVNLASLFFIKLVRKFSRSAEIHRNTDPKNKIWIEMLSYINENYSSITLSSLASHFNYSEEHCSRIIKSETGQTFTMILRKIRLTSAEAMLLNTPYSVEHISYKIGYENPCTFGNLFKQEYGISPGQYRLQKTSSRSISS